MIVGGGLGRTPIIGHVIREFLPWRHLLTYLDAILRVYNRYGRRDNKYKARIKILVKDRDAGGLRRRGRSGVGAPRRTAPAPWCRKRSTASPRSSRAPPTIGIARDMPMTRLELQAHVSADRAFARWVERNVHPHRVPGYAAVTLSLKKTGVPPGDATAEQMDAVADLADRYSFGEIRVSHEQNLVFADVPHARPARAVAAAQGAGLRHAQRRPAHQHHRLPGRRLLLARQRRLDSGGRGDPAPLRRSRLPVRHRRAGSEHLGLHERLRPPSRRPHRHPRCRQERRGVVPDHHRRPPGRAGRARPA